MTYVLNLKPETAKQAEEKAKASGVTPERWLETLAETAIEGGEGVSDAEFKATMNRVFDRYQQAFEVLAEGAK